MILRVTIFYREKVVKYDYSGHAVVQFSCGEKDVRISQGDILLLKKK
jgi:hypothetical protein